MAPLSLSPSLYRLLQWLTTIRYYRTLPRTRRTSQLLPPLLKLNSEAKKVSPLPSVSSYIHPPEPPILWRRTGGGFFFLFFFPVAFFF